MQGEKNNKITLTSNGIMEQNLTSIKSFYLTTNF